MTSCQINVNDFELDKTNHPKFMHVIDFDLYDQRSTKRKNYRTIT